MQTVTVRCKTCDSNDARCTLAIASVGCLEQPTRERDGKLPTHLKIEDMLAGLSSRREQPIPHKRPNESGCQKKRNCDHKQNSIDGDVDLVTRDDMASTCLSLLEDQAFPRIVCEQTRCWFCTHITSREGISDLGVLRKLYSGLFEAAGRTLKTVGSLL